ncbi:hypothetical protein [Nitrosomonas sp.]|uniref:cupin domain-containing protein n=1 Tax=Nitrosomonas sp. TaxID=42353 RepID=UPI0034537481
MISLGGITPKDFLRDYWQQRPLLVRNALPGFGGLLTCDELTELACHEDAQSRLVIQRNGKWHLKHGPLSSNDLAKLPKKQWTLLVQDVNHFLPSARDLLSKFRFIPHARLDDLMVSYAPKGGGSDHILIPMMCFYYKEWGLDVGRYLRSRMIDS